MIKSWNAENVEIAQRDVSDISQALARWPNAFSDTWTGKSTWATQKKNLDTLTEAYNTCRHVILFFSVNNSRAFQGYVSPPFSLTYIFWHFIKHLFSCRNLNPLLLYLGYFLFDRCFHLIFTAFSDRNKARMASAPGAAPTPSWAKQLIWESTPPFFIEWIATSETRFNRCGYLKNSLNEGQAVLVGRDGQEIEESCGRGLCELIDSMANYGSSGENEWRSHGSPGVWRTT